MKNNNLIPTLLIGVLAGFSGTAFAAIESDSPIGVHFDSAGNASQAKSLIDGETGISGTSIRYQSFAASGMTTIRNSDTYIYSGGGCMRSLGTYSGFDEDLDLPHGTRLVSVSYLVNDQDATGRTKGLLFSGNETFSEFASFTTTNDEVTGFTNIGGYIDFTIDNNLEFVTSRLEINSGTNSEVCAVRIGFITPEDASDVIFSDTFFR